MPAGLFRAEGRHVFPATPGTACPSGRDRVGWPARPVGFHARSTDPRIAPWSGIALWHGGRGSRVGGKPDNPLELAAHPLLFPSPEAAARILGTAQRCPLSFPARPMHEPIMDQPLTPSSRPASFGTLPTPAGSTKPKTVGVTLKVFAVHVMSLRRRVNPRAWQLDDCEQGESSSWCVVPPQSSTVQGGPSLSRPSSSVSRRISVAGLRSADRPLPSLLSSEAEGRPYAGPGCEDRAPVRPAVGGVPKRQPSAPLATDIRNEETVKPYVDKPVYQSGRFSSSPYSSMFYVYRFHPEIPYAYVGADGVDVCGITRGADVPHAITTVFAAGSGAGDETVLNTLRVLASSSSCTPLSRDAGGRQGDGSLGEPAIGSFLMPGRHGAAWSGSTSTRANGTGRARGAGRYATGTPVAYEESLSLIGP